jgi:hypothetical protein
MLHSDASTVFRSGRHRVIALVTRISVAVVGGRRAVGSMEEVVKLRDAAGCVVRSVGNLARVVLAPVRGLNGSVALDEMG